MNRDLQKGRPVRSSADKAMNDVRSVIPVVEEQLEVSKRTVASGGAVRLRKIVHEDAVTVDVPLENDVVEVERIAVDRPVDADVAVRYEGDVMIVPVLEERLVTRKQLYLVEEIRVTRHTRQESVPQDVALLREEVIAERLDPVSGKWERIEAEASRGTTSV